MSTTARRTPAEKNLAAEVRFVEAGHRAYVGDGGAISVVSDTKHGKSYRVTFHARSGEAIVFTCTPRGEKAFEDDHLAITFERGALNPGVAPCMHCAGAARRLEREGLAKLDADGRWVSTAPVTQAELDEEAERGARLLARVARVTGR